MVENKVGLQIIIRPMLLALSSATIIDLQGQLQQQPHSEEMLDILGPNLPLSSSTV